MGARGFAGVADYGVADEMGKTSLGTTTAATTG
jgi:hypothetical protein